MKAGWHIIEANEELWVRTLKSKYKCGSGILPRVSNDRFGSNFWSGICKAWPDQVSNNVAWRIGDGSLVKV